MYSEKYHAFWTVRIPNFTLEITHNKKNYLPFTHFVWPNPGNGNFFITGVGSAAIRLFDLRGRFLDEKSGVTNGMEIHYPALSPGVYILEVLENDRKMYQRLEIIR